jgi:5-oxoprolinase (ATP-hydrolysing)
MGVYLINIAPPPFVRTDLAAVRSDLLKLKSLGFKSIAIAFVHSFIFADHEIAVEKLALELFEHVSRSSAISPMAKLVPRASSACADAYLTPELQRYLGGFQQSFVNLRPGVLQFMQSDGGLVGADRFSGMRAILSGPAGGVVGYARTCYDEGDQVAVIGFDMVCPP